MSAALMMGVDIGTTSTKAVIFTLDGEPVAHHAVDYPLHRPTPAAAEQDPQQIYLAVLEAIRQSVRHCTEVPRALVGIGFSAAMHSVIAVDAQDRLLTRSITWADNRAADWAQRIRSEYGGDAIYRRTGTPIHPMSPLVKLAWLREDEPALFARTARFIGIKEYVFFRLFGRYVVDHSIASATGLLDLSRLDWDDEALAVAGVRRDQLSSLVPTTYSLRGLDHALARDLGLDADTPFVIGANDGVLSNLGVDSMAPGDVAVTIGTSAALRGVVDRPRTDPAGRTFCYALTEHHWVVGGPINNGGIVLRWARDELAAAECEQARQRGQDPYDVLSELAQQAPAGADGLLFHPYLSGERAPWWNADLRGSFFGLATHHRREHLIRAVFEGVIFSLCSILPALESLVGPTRRIQATGGFARSALWRQMVADILDQPVEVPRTFESSCLGAAVLGAWSVGCLDSLDAVREMVGPTYRHVPDAASAAAYRQLLPIFLSLPVQLETQYRQIAQFQRRWATPSAESSKTARDPAPSGPTGGP